MLNSTLPVLDINRHRSTACTLRTQPLKRCLLMNRFIHLSSHPSSFQSNEMCSFNCAFCSIFFPHNPNRLAFVFCSRRPAAQLCEKCFFFFFCSIALVLMFAHVDEVHRCCNDLKWFLKRCVIVLQHILFYLIQELLADLVAAGGQTAPFHRISIKAAIVEKTKIYLPSNISLASQIFELTSFCYSFWPRTGHCYKQLTTEKLLHVFLFFHLIYKNNIFI